jgi:hypothetical protein
VARKSTESKMRAGFGINILKNFIGGDGGTHRNRTNDRHQIINLLVRKECQKQELISQFVKEVHIVPPVINNAASRRWNGVQNPQTLCKKALFGDVAGSLKPM